MRELEPEAGGALRRDELPTIRVLLVEDDSEAASAIRTALDAHDAARFEVSEAHDAESALVLLRDRTYDLALLDLSLPEGDGVEILMRAREVLRTLPVVVMADRDDEALALEALRFGAQDYLCKEAAAPAEIVRSARHAVERHCLRVQLTEARRREHHLATHDVLTGLPNRHWLDEYLRRMLASASRRGTQVAVLFLDLDGFKRVNDTLGHGAGDMLLKEVANRLSATCRRSDAITRLGGDEFILMLNDLVDSHIPAKVAEKVLRAIEQPFRIEGTDQWLTGSIGIALAPNDGETPEDLIRCADIAMYQAKTEGRNRYFFHRQGLNDAVAHRANLVIGLREALQQDHLLLHYQPQFDVQAGGMIGAEALIRWHHPERGLVSPGEFIPIAEEAGLIGPIGLWVIRRALQERRRWESEGHSGLRISVNVSGQQLSMVSFSDEVARILRDENVAPGSLEIEITESTVLSKGEAIQRNLSALREQGVGVALDDFGTGYSSLTLLQNLKVDTLKIDRSFTSRLVDDPRTRVIVSNLVRMATGLGIVPIAEGVETLEDLDQVLSLGCPQVQGFLLSRPIPGDELLPLLGQEQAPWTEVIDHVRDHKPSAE